jgi:hypothetical protein
VSTAKARQRRITASDKRMTLYQTKLEAAKKLVAVLKGQVAHEQAHRTWIDSMPVSDATAPDEGERLQLDLEPEAMTDGPEQDELTYSQTDAQPGGIYDHEPEAGVVTWAE